jgi:DNA repair protein RadC
MEVLENLQNEYVALQSGIKGVDIKNLSKEVREKFERLKELYNQRQEIKKTMGNP